MNKEVIIVKNPGHDVPRGYLQTALKACPTYLGVSVQGDDGEGQPMLETSAENKAIEIDDLTKMLAGLKDVRVVLQLGAMSQDFDPESDMMPYTFQVAGATKDDPPTDVLSVHLEGDFPNYSKPGEGHTEAFNLWDNFIYPTVLEKFEASEDVDAFFERLRKSNFEQAVMNTVSHRAVAVFVPQYGDIISFGRNELGAEYDWGTTSNTFDWGTTSKLETAVTNAVASAGKKLGRLAKAMGSTAVTPPEVPKKEDPKPDVHHTNASPKPLNAPDKPTPGKKDDDKSPWDMWTGCSTKTHKLVPVPPGLQNNARNRWIRTFLGLGPDAELPKGYGHKDFKIPVLLDLIGFAQEDVSTNEDVKKLQSRIVRFQTPGAKEDAPSVTEDEPAQVQQPKQKDAVPPEEKRPPADFLPEMSADDAKISAELVTEWATNPKKPTALEIQKQVAKWPKFSVARGITFRDYSQWTIADVKMLGKKAPNALALAFVELQQKVLELGGFEADVNVEVKEKDDTKSPAVVAAPVKSGPAPTKGGRLARAKGG